MKTGTAGGSGLKRPEPNQSRLSALSPCPPRGSDSQLVYTKSPLLTTICSEHGIESVYNHLLYASQPQQGASARPADRHNAALVAQSFW